MTRLITSFNLCYLFSKWYLGIKGHIAYYLLRQYLAYIYTSTNWVLVATLSTQCSQLSTTCLRSFASTCFQSGQIDRTVQMSVKSYRHAVSTRAFAVRCAHFLATFLRFRCLNVTTLFNIDVKNTFSCRRDCHLLCCYSALLLWTCLFFNACLRYFSLHFHV